CSGVSRRPVPRRGMTDSADYHLSELRVALDPSNASHSLPGKLPAGCRVLDVGCGAGQTLIALRHDRLAFGIDRNLDALRLGRTLSSAIAFSSASGEALPFRDGSFDIVLSRVALPYMRIGLALGEMRRVLVPGGSVWLALHPLSNPWRAGQRALRQGD